MESRSSLWRKVIERARRGGFEIVHFYLNVQKETVEIESPAAIHKYSYKRMLLKYNNEVI